MGVMHDELTRETRRRFMEFEGPEVYRDANDLVSFYTLTEAARDTLEARPIGDRFILDKEIHEEDLPCSRTFFWGDEETPKKAMESARVSVIVGALDLDAELHHVLDLRTEVYEGEHAINSPDLPHWPAETPTTTN